MRELDGKKIIDIHAHILPGVDDGARDLKESIALAVSAASQGIRAVIATPHFSRRGDPDEYDELLKSVQTEIWKSCPDFQLYLGQELYYHEDLGDRLLSGQALTLADSSYILVKIDPAVAVFTDEPGNPESLWSGVYSCFSPCGEVRMSPGKRDAGASPGDGRIVSGQL